MINNNTNTNTHKATTTSSKAILTATSGVRSAWATAMRDQFALAAPSGSRVKSRVSEAANESTPLEETPSDVVVRLPRRNVKGRVRLKKQLSHVRMRVPMALMLVKAWMGAPGSVSNMGAALVLDDNNNTPNKIAHTTALLPRKVAIV